MTHDPIRSAHRTIARPRRTGEINAPSKEEDGRHALPGPDEEAARRGRERSLEQRRAV